jgi:hypothetical protein
MRNPHAKSLREAIHRQRVIANRKRARREQERLRELINDDPYKEIPHAR